MMFRSAMNQIDAHSETTAMIGDRMDTDIIAGMEAGLHTVLVLSGLTTGDDIARYPFRPNQILSGVHELIEPDLGLATTTGIRPRLRCRIRVAVRLGH